MTAPLRGLTRYSVMRRSATLLTVLASLSAPAAASADELLDQTQTATPVSSYANAQAWSRATGSSGYALMLRVGGVTTAAPIDTRGVPFDVDLGSDRHGRLTAVYSRCQREPDFGAGGIPTANGDRCRLYALDVAAGVERRLRRAAPGSSEFLPTISGTRVAFARTSAAHRVARIYLSRPGRRLLRLPGGRRGVVGATPTRLDLAGSRLAVGWRRLAKLGGGDGPADLGPGPNLVTSVLLDRLDGRQTIIEEIRSGQAGKRLALPSLWRGTVYYGLGGQLRSYRAGIRRHEPLAAPGGAFSVAASPLGTSYSMFMYGGRGIDCRTFEGACRVALRPR